MWSLGTVGLRACSRRVDVANLVGGLVSKPYSSHQSLIRSLSTSRNTSCILSSASRFSPSRHPASHGSLSLFAPALRFASSSTPTPPDVDNSSTETARSATTASVPAGGVASSGSSLASRLSGRIKKALQTQLSKSAPKSKDGASPAPTTFPDMSRLFSLAMPQKKNIAIALALLLVSSCITLTVPFAIGRLIDFFTSGQNAIFGLSFGSIAALMLLIFALGAGAKAGSNILLELSGVRVVQGIRSQAYKSALRQDVELADKGAGDVVSRLSVDTNIVGDSLTSDIGDGLRAGVTVLFAGTAMCLISSKLTLLMMAVVPPAAIGAVFYGRYLRELTHRTQEAIGQMTRLAEERLSPPAFRTLTAFNTQRQESRRFDGKINAIVELQTKEAFASGFFYAGTGFVGNCAILTLLTYGGHLVSRGEISVGDLTSLLMYTAYLGGGMVSLTSFFASLMKGLGAGARVFELIDRESNVALGKGETLALAAPSASASATASGSAQVPIRFENVHFSYPSRPTQPILRGVTLDIEPGQSYALVGGSGAGKSSVHSLLLRFYDPSQGRITIAGKDLASFTPESVRKQLAFVPQEPVLFDGSIEENIKYGSDSATREQVQEAARMAGCESFISSLPRGIDTVIGSRQLSGGQRQRIAIARALVRQPSILLLDEATSALDSASESTVNSAIQHIIRQGNITVWIVAHRLSTIKSANNIQVLENGKIVEQGTFAQLDEPGSRFRALMAAQLDQPPVAQTDDVLQDEAEPTTPAAHVAPSQASMGGRRMYSTRARAMSHPAIPEKGTWSLASIIRPSVPDAEADEMLSEPELLKLHKLAALLPPSTPGEMQKLNKQLYTLLRLVRGIHAPRIPSVTSTETTTTTESPVDSRVLAQDASWHVSLPADTPTASSQPRVADQIEEEQPLHRETQLLSHVDNSRKYGGYFVVKRF